MKSLLALTLAFVAQTAFASNSSDSWSTIRNDYSVSIREPAFAAEVGGIFNACEDGQFIRSISPMQVCTKWDSGTPGRGEAEEPTLPSCRKSELRHGAVEMTKKETVCLKWRVDSGGEGRGSVYECLKYGEAVVTLPKNLQLDVYNNYGEQKEFLYSKEFTIPACQ